MYKILIADDEAMIRQGIKCLFDWEDLGYVIVDEAANGTSAYEKIMEHTPDVVLMDIRMPGMLGLEVIRKARENGFNGKVIILSGYSDFNYAQEAIRYGVVHYLTKPIDEDELEAILHKIRTELDKAVNAVSAAKHYREKAHDSIVKDILRGNADISRLNLTELHMISDIYQVVIYEKYSHLTTDVSYRFSDLLRVTNQDNHSFDTILLDQHEVILLKGRFAVQQFNDFLERYEREKRPQKDSPLDSLFITYGRCVNSLLDVPFSYEEASKLLHRRFFCDQGQHTIGFDSLPDFEHNTPIINDAMRDDYAARLLNYIQAFNRNKTGETLRELQDTLYNASDSIDSIKLFLADLFLKIKEQINHLYNTVAIPFAGNAEIIRGIQDKCYLHEIILFFSAQFEIIMSSIGNSSRDSVLDDILHYINHNYSSNITLENIAPLFGYNSSYLGKIFSKKMGENFNSYVDHIRIERSKEMLLHEDLKVYHIAEKVGYRNVDYFHIKFKKYVGQSPAEFRKKHKDC